MCIVQFIVVVSLDDVAGIPANLQDKLRVRVKELNERNISVLKMCQEADQVSTQKFGHWYFLLIMMFRSIVYVLLHFFFCMIIIDIYVHTSEKCLWDKIAISCNSSVPCLNHISVLHSFFYWHIKHYLYLFWWLRLFLFTFFQQTQNPPLLFHTFTVFFTNRFDITHIHTPVYTQWGAESHISRMEFKGVLKKMGYGPAPSIPYHTSLLKFSRPTNIRHPNNDQILIAEVLLYRLLSHLISYMHLTFYWVGNWWLCSSVLCLRQLIILR